MKRVIVTIGPQYAGKSTFCAEVVKAHPDVVLVSRDAILTEMFGSPWLDPYTGDHFVGLEKMWEIVVEHLKQPRITLILDTWNDSPRSRAEIAEKLAQAGAERVDGWYFMTPLVSCVRWSFKRDPIPVKNRWSILRRRHRVRSYAEAYAAYHNQEIEREDNFHSVRRINARDAMPTDILSALPS